MDTSANKMMVFGAGVTVGVFAGAAAAAVTTYMLHTMGRGSGRVGGGGGGGTGGDISAGSSASAGSSGRHTPERARSEPSIPMHEVVGGLDMKVAELSLGEAPQTPRVAASPTTGDVVVLDPEEAMEALLAQQRWAKPPPVHRIVLTGAPCGGKTSSLGRLTEQFTAEGFRVYAVPEVATLLWSGGVKVEDLSSDLAVYQFQDTLLKLILALEDGYYSLAVASGQKALILCDRGTCDARAYMSSSLWQAMLDENHWTNVAIRDKRYDCVVHLVTAAIGAEEHYEYGPGTPRMEPPEVAIALDKKIRRAWLGHPYLVIVDNSEPSFEAKLNRVVDVVSKRVAGKTESQYRKRKFLLMQSPPESLFYQHNIAFEQFEVHQHYLKSRGSENAAIRKRGQFGSYTYTHIIRENNVESRYALTGRQYVSLLAERDPSRVPIHQTRRYFMWQSRLYHVDVFLSPKAIRSVVFLQTYVSDDEPASTQLVPDWIKSVKEVTDDPRFTMYHYSQAARGVTDILNSLDFPASRLVGGDSDEEHDIDDDDDKPLRVTMTSS